MGSPGISHATVGIVGGGPAGLMLSHLLHVAGIASVVIDDRSRSDIETTIRAGILEQDSVRLLLDSGASDRVLRDGYQHEGIELAFGGSGHRLDFRALVDASVWLYPQTAVFIDLAEARQRDGGRVHFGVTGSRVTDLTTDAPAMFFTDADGLPHEVRCDYLVGADGSRSMCRHEVPVAARQQFFREYPFAWFGILCEAPPSWPELIYNQGPQGFALISSRTDSVQRMYFQCAPDADPESFSEPRIWDELQSRVAANGYSLKEGPIFEKSVLKFRSFVQEPMQYGRLLLAGDAAHTVPPTGAKGLNLALADVRVLAECLELAVRRRDPDALSGYTPKALARVWKAAHFSYWMTTMLHRLPEMTDFDVRRQTAELASVVGSTAGSTFLAEGYTGWPAPRH